MSDTGLLAGANCLWDKTLATIERDTHSSRNLIRGISTSGLTSASALAQMNAVSFNCAFRGFLPENMLTETLAFNSYWQLLRLLVTYRQ